MEAAKRSARSNNYLASMLALKEYDQLWDGFLPDHVTTTVQDKDILDKCIEVCSRIVADGEWPGEHEGPRGGWVCSNGDGGITYRKDNIFESRNGYLKVPEDYTR